MDYDTEQALRKCVATRADLFGAGASYLDFESDPSYRRCGFGFKADWLFGRIVYDSEGTARSSPSIAVKRGHKQGFFLNSLLVLEFVNELYFYSQTLPYFSAFRDFGHAFPKFYGGQLGLHVAEDFQATMVFENVQASGFGIARSKLLVDYEHLALMMRTLGEFHAYSYLAKNGNSVRFNVLADSFTETHFVRDWRVGHLISQTVIRGWSALKSEPRYAAKAHELEVLVKTSDQFLLNVLQGGRDDPKAVLCHGDYLLHNVLFAYDQQRPVQLKIVDWATCKLASPYVDLLPLLYINANQRMRDEHWDDLLNEYYDALKGTFPGNEVPSKQSIVDGFKRNAWFAYVVASYFVIQVIAAEDNLPSQKDLLPQQYRNTPTGDIPKQILYESVSKLGGERATQVLTAMLKDMIDRGFL